MASLLGAAPALISGPCGLCKREHRQSVDPRSALEALTELFAELALDKGLAAEHSALASSRGKMIGVLVGRDGRGATITLKSFSGDLGGLEDWPGWAPAVVRRASTAALEAQTLSLLARLDQELASADADRRVSLRRARRAASAQLMDAMLDAICLTNAAQLRLPLRRVFAGRGIPSGTATCGLPKLLSAANHLGVTPLAVAEAWWGPPLGERQHGLLGAPCARRCLPILGFLLCHEGHAQERVA